jgi:NAD(P)-dependent dehydrogenase (short-subunit alcohol dehydrogenase family)
VEADVGQPVQVKRLFDGVRNRLGGLDFLSSNAGLGINLKFESKRTLMAALFD